MWNKATHALKYHSNALKEKTNKIYLLEKQNKVLYPNRIMNKKLRNEIINTVFKKYSDVKNHRESIIGGT